MVEVGDIYWTVKGRRSQGLSEITLFWLGWENLIYNISFPPQIYFYEYCPHNIKFTDSSLPPDHVFFFIHKARTWDLA